MFFLILLLFLIFSSSSNLYVPQVDRMKDNQMAASLQQVKDNVQSWDSTKCPPVK